MITRNQIYALTAGLAAGAAVAFLYAPQSGADTRQDITDGFTEATNRLTSAGEYLREQAKFFNAQAQAAMIENTRKGVEAALEQAANTVSATLNQASKAFSANVDQVSAAIGTVANSYTVGVPNRG